MKLCSNNAVLVVFRTYCKMPEYCNMRQNKDAQKTVECIVYGCKIIDFTPYC